jgi:hypothetical protein
LVYDPLDASSIVAFVTKGALIPEQTNAVVSPTNVLGVSLDISLSDADQVRFVLNPTF